jgi:hypothetical protein
MAMTETATPPGCVGIYTDKEGRVIASVSDFKEATYGGFSLYEGQKVRAKRALAHAVVDAYCSSIVAEALDGYECERLVGSLPGKMTFLPVGQTNNEC